MTMVLIGFGAGGCSFSRNDTSAYAKADDSDLTGSIARPAKDAAPTETDLAFARNAASDVRSKGGKDSSQHWENPVTGARGSMTPMTHSYADANGRRCRNFIAIYVHGNTEVWHHAAGCQRARVR